MAVRLVVSLESSPIIGFPSVASPAFSIIIQQSANKHIKKQNIWWTNKQNLLWIRLQWLQTRQSRIHRPHWAHKSNGCTWIWRYEASNQHLQVIRRLCVLFLQRLIYPALAYTPGSHKKHLNTVCLSFTASAYFFRLSFCIVRLLWAHSSNYQVFFHCLSYLIFYEVTFPAVALFGLRT